MTGGEDKSGNFLKRKRFRTRKNPKQRKYKKRKQKRNQMNMIQNVEEEKPKINYGQSFWNNYRKAMEWQSSYMEGYWRQKAQTLYQENVLLKQRLSQPTNVPSSCSEEIFLTEETYSEEESEEISSDIHSEFEVSEEFMKFIEISLKHKEALNKDKRSRKEKRQGTNPQDKPDASDSEGMLMGAPMEDSGMKRREEMKELYGSGSAMIHGMETAMHLSFMRKCDKNKPVLWPVVPLYNSLSTSAAR